MLEIRHIKKPFLIASILIWIVGCGSGGGGGSSSNSSTDQFRHPSDHQTAFLSDPDLCVRCHGADLRGGEVGVSCFSEDFDAIICHANGPNSHPSGWSDPAQHGAAAKAAPAINSGFSYCRKCHGQELAGGFIAVSCFTCHGESSCSLCHNDPPSGTQYPDTAGKHAKHTALANVDCSTCHTGAGGGTVNHYNGSVEVSFAPEFNSKSGTASFDATSKKCSRVSCHGGPRTQTASQAVGRVSTPAQTPDWMSGAITVDTQCILCHVYGTPDPTGLNPPGPEYNSYYSGRHKKHVYEKNILCTECHETDKLAVDHFTNLDTPAISYAGATIWDDIGYNGVSCTVFCHTFDHNQENW